MFPASILTMSRLAYKRPVYNAVDDIFGSDFSLMKKVYRLDGAVGTLKNYFSRVIAHFSQWPLSPRRSHTPASILHDFCHEDDTMPLLLSRRYNILPYCIFLHRFFIYMLYLRYSMRPRVYASRFSILKPHFITIAIDIGCHVPLSFHGHTLDD